MNMNQIIKAIVFDLDGTLYDSNVYWIGVFNEISEYLFNEYRIRKNRSYNILINIFNQKSSSYGYLFNDLLKQININQKFHKQIIKKLFYIYHNHVPNIVPYKDVIPTLTVLKNDYELAIISNGKPSTQRKKVKYLGLNDYFDYSLFLEGENIKPNTKPYLTLSKKLNIKPNEMIYVGDNPYVDFSGKKLGLKTIRIMRGEFKKVNISNEFEADYVLRNLNDSLNIINNIQMTF